MDVSLHACDIAAIDYHTAQGASGPIAWIAIRLKNCDARLVIHADDRGVFTADFLRDLAIRQNLVNIQNRSAA